MYIVKTSRVPGPGKRTKVAILRLEEGFTEDDVKRIDVRDRAVKEVTDVDIVGPEDQGVTIARFEQSAMALNEPSDQPSGPLFGGDAVCCTKCGGVGSIPAFDHKANGVCFRCNGTGAVSIQLFRQRLLTVRQRLVNDKDQIRLDWIHRSTFEQWASMTDAQFTIALDWWREFIGKIAPLPQPLLDRETRILNATAAKLYF